MTATRPKPENIAARDVTTEGSFRTLMQSAQLMDTRLTLLEARTLPGFEDDPVIPSGLHPEVPEFRLNFDPELPVLFCWLRFRMWGSEPEVPDSPEPLYFVAEYELLYHLEGSHVVDDEVEKAFVMRSAFVNTWPLVRELFDSVSRTMGFGNLEMPSLVSSAGSDSEDAPPPEPPPK